MLKNCIVVLVGLSVVSCAKRAQSAPWNPEKAATYLDQRGKDWVEWSRAQRGTGETKTACLCCHTTVPLVMARPLIDGNSALVRKVTEQVTTRVTNFGELDSAAFQLMYDFDENVKRESRGTEAVLNAVVLAFDDHHQKRAAPSATTTKAFKQLWSTQSADGSWAWLSPQFELEPWESTQAQYFGVALAVLAVGIAPGEPIKSEGLTKARAFLRTHLAKQNLHNQLWALWAQAETSGALTPADQASVAKLLLALQRKDGGWSVSSLGSFNRSTDASDGYATGLATLVLGRLGGHSGPAKRGLKFLRKNQSASGAWIASSVNKTRKPNSHVGRFMSDAATAMAVLALRDKR